MYIEHFLNSLHQRYFSGYLNPKNLPKTKTFRKKQYNYNKQYSYNLLEQRCDKMKIHIKRTKD